MKSNIDKLVQYQSLFWTPDYIDASSAWIEHIPFAFWIVEVLKPKTLVELGVQTATSYFSFCQAVSRLNIDTLCYGVDSWKGDEHAGFYGEDIFGKVTNYNTKEFYRFSTLIKSTFDEAKEYFIDKSIDLLHIDGFHTYEAVKHDFEQWLPKLSNKSFVFFHDINVRERNFGVFKLWEELKSEYEHFQFDFGHGLGIISIGKIIPEELKQLFEKNNPYSVFLRNIFSERGNFFRSSFFKDLELDQEKNTLKELTRVKAQLSESNNILQLNNVQLTEVNNTLQSQNAQLIEKNMGLELSNTQLTESNNTLQLDNAQLVENKDALELSNRQFQENFNTLELINRELHESHKELIKDYERLKGHYTDLEARNSRLQEKCRKDSIDFSGKIKELESLTQTVKEMSTIKKENELFKKYIAWYRDTYETRSMLGVLKEKIKSKFKKENVSPTSGEDSASKTFFDKNPIDGRNVMPSEENASGLGDSAPVSEVQRLGGTGKSPYFGKLSIRYQVDISNLSKVCIFSSFSFSGQVEEYVFYYLDELKKAGFSILFVSTSTLPESCVHRLSQYTCLIVERENICPDFGSWKAGLSMLNWEKLDAVLLTNDSVFGPLFNLDDIIVSMKDRYDVWGMSENYETDHHLQSYFLNFNKRAITSEIFRTFWDNVDLSAVKEEVIEKYEIGISRLFRDSGFRLGAYANIDVVSKHAPDGYKLLNQLVVCWKPLIKNHEFPFLKRELIIRKNISKIHEQQDIYVNTSGWRKLVEECSLYPVRLIEDFMSNYYRLNKMDNNDLILQRRKVLFLIDPTEDAEAQRILLDFLHWLKAKTHIEVELVSSKEDSELTPRFAKLGTITNLHALSDAERKSLKGRLIDEISVIFSNTIRHVDAQKFLSYLDVPQIIFVHETASLLDRLPPEDDLNWIRNNVSNFVTDSDVSTRFIIEYVGIDRTKVELVDRSYDFTAVQAPALLRIINNYYDDKELRLAEDPVLVFMTHIYYDNSWIEIRNKLRNFNNRKNYFLFSISEGCITRNEIIEDIKETFDNAFFLVTPNVGRDIGGKLALIDLYLFLAIKSAYIVILHDKQSIHSVEGESWKNDLFKVIDVNNQPIIMDLFRDPAVGVVGVKNWIVNEYDARTDSFTNNSELSKKLRRQFHISIENYDFIGGCIFWIRSSIIEKFFRRNDPILIRGELEPGNVLDLHGERMTHTWERMFNWIATNDGYRVDGI
jgi:lipopolysaccharide biosynthesis protein